MVFATSLIPWIILAIGSGLIFTAKSRKMQVIFVCCTIVTIGVYSKMLPSYVYKGDIERSAVPEFSTSRAEIQDRNRKPVPQEVVRQKQYEQYKQGLNY